MSLRDKLVEDAAIQGTGEERDTGLVVPQWLLRLSYQQQSVVLLALRGPDGVRKDHPAKVVQVAYRACILRAAYRQRWLRWGEAADGFMSLAVIADEAAWREAVGVFFRHVDELPHHYVAHLAHAAEILAYRHPDSRVAQRWALFYVEWCTDLHLPAETHAEMNRRLSDWGTARVELERRGHEFRMKEDDE